MKNLLFIFILLSISTAVYARMYQWVDPDTGTSQLSGKPPHWYRSDTPGPRVIVFENGRVIDDTGIVVSEDENERLRQDAIIIVERDRLSAMEKMLRARRQKFLLESQQEESEELDDITFETLMDDDEDIDYEDINDEDETSVEEMRALVEEYERTRGQLARDIVESAETD
jgi:hypothetical protein